MGGGVSPFEWILPPLALTHTIVDQGAKLAGQKLPPVPGSMDAEQDARMADMEANRLKMLAEQDAAKTKAEADLAARTETPQEAAEARRRAGAAAQSLGGGKRRASQTLTDPGMTLSGSY